MEKSMIQRLKRTQLLLLLAAAVLLFFGGCGGAEPEVRGLEPESIRAGLEEGGGETALEGTSEGESGGEVLSLPVSAEKSTVDYQGESFLCSFRVIGGDGIWLTGYEGELSGDALSQGKLFCGRIAIGENQMQKFSLDMPENAFALRGCVDSSGRCHILFTEKTDNIVTYERLEIWVLNARGEREQLIDLTAFPEADSLKQSWRWMAADIEGNYYLANESRVLAINTDSESIAEYCPESGSVEGIGIGKSETVYGVFAGGEERYLARISFDGKAPERCADLTAKGTQPSFTVLQPGVETELLLANQGEGLWSYDGEEIKLEVPLESIVGNGQDILGMGFLADGRCCVMSREDGSYRFYYVPVEGRE